MSDQAVFMSACSCQDGGKCKHNAYGPLCTQENGESSTSDKHAGESGRRWLNAFDAASALEGEVYEAVCEIFQGEEFVNDVGCDPYDSSLEVYLSDRALPEWTCTQSQQYALLALGFRQFWLNFPDQTEQYGREDKLTERKPRNRHNTHPPKRAPLSAASSSAPSFDQWWDSLPLSYTGTRSKSEAATVWHAARSALSSASTPDWVKELDDMRYAADCPSGGAKEYKEYHDTLEYHHRKGR